MSAAAPPDPAGFEAPALARALLDGPEAIVATDRAGIIRFWNGGAARLFGFEPGEALGRSLDIVIPEGLRERHWQGYHRVMATGHSRYGEGDVLAVPAMTRDGRRISVEFTVALLRDGTGEAVGMAAVMRDVTRRFEELKSLRRAIAALAADAIAT